MKPKKSRAVAVNLFYLITMSIISVYLSFAKASSILFGRGQSMATIVCFVLTIALVAGNIVVYYRNHESRWLRVTVFLTYLFANCFLMYSGKNISTYAYLFQGMICSMLFMNLKYVIFVLALTNAANLIDVVLLYGQVEDTTILLVHIVAVLIFSIIIYEVTKISNYFNEEAMEQLTAEKNQQKLYAARGLKLGKATGQKVHQVNELAAGVDEASERVAQALLEIKGSTQSTAENLEEQTKMSQNIQEIVEHTKNQADVIGQATDTTAACVQEGMEAANKLKQQAVIVDQAGQNVIGATQILMEKTEEVQKITDVILGIADSTDLLALNASIEAARAGAQGAGFAVVAEEIRTLAEQTKHATLSISGLLEELHKASNTVKDAVDTIGNETEEQKRLIDQVDNRFSQVHDTMGDLEGSVTTLHGKVEELAYANETIVGNINNLSAASQQVSAQTMEVYELCDHNMKDINAMSGLVSELSEDVQGFERIVQEQNIETSEV